MNNYNKSIKIVAILIMAANMPLIIQRVACSWMQIRPVFLTNLLNLNCILVLGKGKFQFTHANFAVVSL